MFQSYALSHAVSVGKQTVAWKEYCVEYWLKELQESITEMMLKRHRINFTGKCFSKIRFFSSTGRRPASLCHGPVSVVRASVRASVRALTFSLNIFFAETTYRILMKFHRNVPTMVLFRIS